METINDRLSQLVNAYSGGNQRKFTELIGLPEGSLSNYLSKAKNSIPGADKLEKIVNSLDVDAMWLLTGKGKMKRTTTFIDDNPVNTELLQLCKSLVANYTQRDEVMAQIVSMIQRLEEYVYGKANIFC